jgi:hypothetical protein
MLTIHTTIPVVGSTRFRIWVLGHTVPLDCRVELLGAKSPGSSPPPTHLATIKVPAHGTVPVDIPMEDPAFAGRYGAVSLTSYLHGSPGNALFAAWASPDPDAHGNPCTGAALVGTYFTIPTMAVAAGEQQHVRLAITNLEASADITVFDPQTMAFSDTFSVAPRHTHLWSSKEHGYDMNGDGQVAILCATATFTVACAIDRNRRIFHMRPLAYG